MAERIEFVGNPLPTGLPGFGGGTVSVLILPGFNTVVAVQQFGPVIDAPTVTPPDPEPPPGSNPENPTPNPVPPAPAPSPSGASSNFCDKCKPPSASEPAGALLKAYHAPSSCRDCRGGQPGTIDWFRTAADSYQEGLFHDGGSKLRGTQSGDQWLIDSNASLGLTIGNVGTQNSCALRNDKVYLGISYLDKGAKIFNGDTAELFEPQELQVCEGGQTKTWKVLAYKPS